MKKELICILLSFTISVFTIMPSIIAVPINLDRSLLEIPDAHLIVEVPYIAQSEGYFCFYSCIAMILGYYGFNTSLNEILFLDGLGYTHYYHPEERRPEEGCYSDISYVLSLFGLEQKRWTIDHDLYSNENWEIYYTRLKENISNDVPVITSVNPFALPSLRYQFMISDFLWNVLFPSGFHIILIVGYNDINNSICFHDTNAGFYGEDSYGEYVWMSLDDFRKGLEQNTWGRYYLSTFAKNNDSLTAQQRFDDAHPINIQKMEGNYSGYLNIHGINASINLWSVFSSDGINKSTTIDLYKSYGNERLKFTLTDFLYKICVKFFPEKPNIFAIYLIGEDNPFFAISQEKNHVADFLENCTFYPEQCLNQSLLLRQEAIKWDELGQLYKNFLRRGYLISNDKSGQLLDEMKYMMEDVISIELLIVE